jgi:hypothetical protein
MAWTQRRVSSNTGNAAVLPGSDRHDCLRLFVEYISDLAHINTAKLNKANR